MESDESAGGAAAQQTLARQGVRGCAAVLCFLAVRSCKAPPYALVSCWEAPVHQAPSAQSCLLPSPGP
jgi:hypothetical protein